MIYLPWVVFALAVLVMIRQGTKAKQEYLRRKVENEQKNSNAETLSRYQDVREHGQGQAPALTGALVGDRRAITGFGQGKN
jgi:hypothetical protein